MSKLPKKLPKLSGSYFKLLTPGNPKTAKGMKKGFMTFVLHMAPANLSGFEVCPKRTNGCTLACLNTAGRGGMLAGVSSLTFDMISAGKQNHIQKARIRRARRYFTERQAFMTDFVADVRKAIKWCERFDLIPVFRPNGTSDLRYETVKIASEGNRTIFEVFPDVQFYDYTKLANRRNIPANYDLTFSRAESNSLDVYTAIANGMRVAAVFRTVKTVRQYMETGFDGFTVIDGDDSDLRFLEPSGVIVGLYAKGANGKADKSGFVID